MNWHLVLALTMAAELEEMLDEPEMAARARREAAELARRVSAAFWDESRSLFADDLSKKCFSEHAQCLAILSGLLHSAQQERVGHALLVDENLARTTIYFSHYLFETCAALGRVDALFDRLGMWFELEKLGFKTTFEEPEPSRSDCHAWGAHPLYHYYASVLGIRPAAPSFAKVHIKPQLGPLAWARGTLPHPKGSIGVSFAAENGMVTGSVELPEGVTGTLITGAGVTDLAPGRQELP